MTPQRLMIVFTAFAMLISFHADPSRAAGPTAIVAIENFSFQPSRLTIAPGTTVTWINRDDVPHTATAQGDSPLFDSKALDTDDKFSFTFNTPGTYPYYCKVHPHMTGVITVK